MTADVRYVRLDDHTYEVRSRGGEWIGDIYHDAEAREWYAHARDVTGILGMRSVGTARTRREATDLILGAS